MGVASITPRQRVTHRDQPGLVIQWRCLIRASDWRENRLLLRAPVVGKVNQVGSYFVAGA